MTVSSIFASNISVNAISANIITANTFIGDGSRLSNIIPASTTVMQGVYSMFTVLAGTAYTGAAWGTQLLSLSTLANQAAPLLLSNDGGRTLFARVLLEHRVLQLRTRITPRLVVGLPHTALKSFCSTGAFVPEFERWSRTGNLAFHTAP
jgi:hypothetical protein